MHMASQLHRYKFAASISMSYLLFLFCEIVGIINFYSASFGGGDC